MITLKNQREFERVFKKGRASSHPDLVVLGHKRRPFGPRVGFCISRKTGKAVVRNKLRRRLKEIMREFEGRLDPQWDLVIVSKPSSASLTYSHLKKRVTKLLQKLGVLASSAELLSR